MHLKYNAVLEKYCVSKFGAKYLWSRTLQLLHKSSVQAVVVAADVYGNANKAKTLYLSRQIVDISWIMKIPFNSLLDRSKNVTF